MLKAGKIWEGFMDLLNFVVSKVEFFEVWQVGQPPDVAYLVLGEV